MKYLGIKKKARKSNKELKDLGCNFLFKISSKKLELQYKIREAEPFSLIKGEKKEKRQVIDYVRLRKSPTTQNLNNLQYI